MGPRKKSSSFQRASANTRTPVTEKPVSSKLPVSSEPVAKPPPTSLWEQICEEYEAEKPAFPEECKIKREAMIRASLVTEMVFQDVSKEPFLSVPRVFMISPSPCPQVKPKAIDSKTCSPKDYLETFIFPVLLPGVARLLHQAKKEKCFERKRTKFIACDFLTEWLYNPRPSIPLSLLLTEEEAALLIQSFWRGYLVRCNPEIQELRQWQKKLQEEKHIRQRVKIFWAKQERKVKCTMEDDKPAAAVTSPP